MQANRLTHIGITPSHLSHLEISRPEIQEHCPEALCLIQSEYSFTQEESVGQISSAQQGMYEDIEVSLKYVKYLSLFHFRFRKQ